MSEPAAIPPTVAVTTNHLRHHYDYRRFTFGNPDAARTICIVGSCRIVPFLNFLRAYNAVNGDPFELICLNPVEMWQGPGHGLDECANERLAGYALPKVDFLICEHLERCGVLNTSRDVPENVFDSLGCSPGVMMKMPNWHFMHMYDAEVSVYDEEYAVCPVEEKVERLRARAVLHKDKFLGRCRASDFPGIADWVEANWLTTRIGWTSEHTSLAWQWNLFERMAWVMGLAGLDSLRSHGLCDKDVYASTCTVLNEIDYEANNWQF